MNYSLFLFFSLFFISILTAQTEPSKIIVAERISNPPKIDGILDDAVWQTLPIHTDFNMLQPSNEGKAPKTHRTILKMAYDNSAVYFAAYMYDDNPSSIRRQFSQRDEINVQADVISIALNTYNDSINAVSYTHLTLPTICSV